MERTKEINVQEILFAILNKIWLIVLAALIGGVALFLYTVNFVTPMYRASVTMYVNNSSRNDVIDYITSSDLSTSQRLVTTYVSVLESDTVLNQVSDNVYEDTGIRVSVNDIRNAMTANPVSDTEVFAVKITHADPQMAVTIANAIAKVAPDSLAQIVEGSSTKVIDYAKIPTSPYSPNRVQNTTIGVVIGVVLAVVIVVLHVLMDVRIKSEGDLAQLSDAPVLGVIPDFDAEESKNSYKYKSSKSDGEDKVMNK